MGPRPDHGRAASSCTPTVAVDREGWHQGTADVVAASSADPPVPPRGPGCGQCGRGLSPRLRAGGEPSTSSRERPHDGDAEVEESDAGRYGVVQVADGKVTDYAYKPDHPRGRLVSNEVFVFDPRLSSGSWMSSARPPTTKGLEDLGDELLPRIVAEGGAHEHRMTTYWRDVGTVDAYWESHLELLDDPAGIDLDDPSGRSAPAGADWAAWPPCSCRRVRADRMCWSRPAPSRRRGQPQRAEQRSRRRARGGGRDSVLLPGARVAAGAARRTVRDR